MKPGVHKRSLAFGVTANAVVPSPPPPMLGEGLAANAPHSREQRIFLTTISPQHWGDAKPLAAKQGGASVAAPT
ncbi:MAG: hypothetical protein DYG96_09360 [Chlorobi bacterium CHB2]|nr:hypothetical protein [Chlorobi bacterium CHB2]